jgi:phage terminase large subunit
MNQFKFLDAYAPIFYEDKTYWIISGGRASGKSTNIAAYFILKLIQPEYFRGVIARYTSKALTNSIYRDILDLIEQWGLSSYLVVKGDEVKNKNNGNLILTHSMKLSEGTMTAKGKGLARVTHLLIDEATELPSEEEYLKLIDSFRHKGTKRKIFLLFNPTAKNHWIFQRFYLPDGSPNPKWKDTHYFLHTTFYDNEDNLDGSKVKEWKDSALIDQDYFRHHILGEWRDIGEGAVFKTWSWSNFEPDPESEIIYGLDFGWTDATALIKIYKKGKTLWIQELIYEQHLTPEDLSDRMQNLGIPKTVTIIGDSAAPMAIEGLQRLGWRNLRKAQKGPDSISTGISKIHSYRVFADPNSPNLIHEYYNYAYKQGTNKPADSFNHLMDAFRYAVISLQEGPKYATVGRGRLRPAEEIF